MTIAADPTAVSAPRISPWAPLRHGAFRALFIAQVASNLGTLMHNVGAAWLMGDVGGSSTMVAMVQTAAFLPVLFIGVPSGALADVVDRRLLLLCTQVATMAVTVALTLLTALHAVSPGSLLLLTGALGVGAAVNAPAWLAIQPDLVPRREFSQAIALGALAYNVGRAVGPAVAGLVIASAGAQWVFAFNAISFLGTVLALALWRQGDVEGRLPAETLRAATRAAFRYGRNSPMLRTVMLRVGLIMFPASAIHALLPLVVRDSLGLGSGAYGLFLACFGLGAAAAAMLRPRIEERASPDVQVGTSTIVLSASLAAVAIAETTFPGAELVIAGALTVGGFAWTNAFTALDVATQSLLPPWVRARGMGLYFLVKAGAVSVGSAFWGVVAGWSVVGAQVCAAAFLLIGLPLACRRSLARASTVDLTPVHFDDPVVALQPRPADGPILITASYCVPDAAMVDFVAAMRIVEMIRRRTGAREWGLYRDLAEPQRFVETFEVDTWIDHLRQRQRITASTDARVAVVRAYVEEGVPACHLVSAFSAGALDNPMGSF